MIDFSSVKNGEAKILDLAKNLTTADLKRLTNESIDWMLELIAGLSDAHMTFDPLDPEANDPYAKEGEEKIGWSLAHLIVHVTASSEEWATYGSILARGIDYPAEPRLRYETPWQHITTQAQCVQRLEESRRIRLGYIAAMPDQPDFEIQRGLSPRYVEVFGAMNAPACVLFGLYHEVGHRAQFEDVKQQALAAQVAAH